MKSGCWEWQGARSHGYGNIQINNKQWGAHRLAWIIYYKQEIPEGEFICHTCDNPPCCNPKHLWLGTSKENIQDAVKKGRLNFARPWNQGEKNGQSKLTETDVKMIRKLRKKTSLGELAKQFHVSKNAIVVLLRQETWKHVKI